MKYFERKEKYNIQDVLQFVEQPKDKKVKKEFDGDMIKMTSDRLYTFKEKGIECVECGIKGAFIAKERTSQKEVFHFNMYAIDDSGNEVLMTKDHIIPKSKGGANHISNYQTMCCKCNIEKGNKL